MNNKLFELALDRLRPSDWEHFEVLSSKFLVSDFPNLRTTANPSGDEGRDSELFSPEGLPNVVTQYSVSADWETKIRKTVNRLKEVQSNASVLIYLTNQIIGAKGDARKAKCLKKGIMLDIRDRNWFLERVNIDDSKYEAATSLVNAIAIPYLEGEDVITKKRAALNSQEAKAALIYLGLQFEDENTEKGLTKIAFESLVRAALRDTHANNRMPRSQIYDRIASYISSYPIDDAKKYIDSALSRLTKEFIRHWTKAEGLEIDEFCLMNDEIIRLREKLAEQECQEIDFDTHIDTYLSSITSDYDQLTDNDVTECRNKIKKIIDIYLIKTGENFALSVIDGEVIHIDQSMLKNVIFNDINDQPLNSNINN